MTERATSRPTARRPSPAPKGAQAALDAWVLDGLLSDGHPVRIRPPVRADRELLCELGRSSDVPLDWLTSRLQGRSPRWGAGHMAFVALRSERGVGVAAYEPTGEVGTAELVMAVAEPEGSRGAAPLLLEALASFARKCGVHRFVAEGLRSGSPTLATLRDSGLALSERRRRGATTAEVDLTPSERYRTRCDAREAAAEAASVAHILRPATVAVVGAGRRPGSVGHEIVRSLLQADFAGAVYPVNPAAGSIAGVPAYRSVGQVPGPVDLAVVAVPPAGVLGAVEDAAAAGVCAAVIVTSGFAEMGEAGARAERAIGEVARRAGMRLVGPNCLGVYNTDPSVRLQATFSLAPPHRGRISLGSQSGAVGVVLSERARHAGAGTSSFVSLGNKLDVSGNDLLCYWEHDPETAVIALYLESIGNPRKFSRIARRVGRTKPIVVLKAGRSTAGARGARSHTAAAATPEVAVQAMLASCGAVEVDTLDELLDVSGLLATVPLPAGRRVGLVGNSGGPLVLAADACAAAGLAIPEIPADVQRRLVGRLPDASALGNPIDMTSGGDAGALEAALRVVGAEPSLDAILVVVTPLQAISATGARAAVAAAAADCDKPIVACIFETRGGAERSDTVADIPSPDRAARAIGLLCEHAEWRVRESGPRLESHWDRYAAARRAVDGLLAARPTGGWLDLAEASDLAAACGLPVATARPAATADEAARAGEALGFPVALKAAAGALVHKSERGGVVLDLGSAEAVAAAHRAMADRLGEEMGGAIVQAMTPPGVETIVGLAVDPSFGPLVMFGLGGVASDLLGDRVFAVPPLDHAAVERLIAAPRTAPLLTGYRSSEPVDLAVLGQVVATVAAIADHLPEVVELDLNPVVCRPDGAVVVDCKVRLAPCPPGPDPMLHMLHRLPSGS